MSRRSLFFALALAAVACEQAPRDLLEQMHEPARPDSVKAPELPDASFSRVALRLARELSSRAKQDFMRCPDETLSHDDGDGNTLLVRVRDARVERKNILPLGLLETLAPDPLERFRETGRPREPADQAALTSLDERRYLAEIVISAFAPPTHFRRLNALHSEWSGGRLEGELVIYELASERVLCASPFRVRGDATAAPLARRLREVTRADLERKLYARALRELTGALSSVTRVLRWPTEPVVVSRND